MPAVAQPVRLVATDDAFQAPASTRPGRYALPSHAGEGGPWQTLELTVAP